MFKLDSPLISFLNKVADIMVLNFMFLLFCVPVFTAGASYTAAYYMGFKMVKNEESYIIKGFWKAFRENFKQATIIWLIVLVFAGLIAGDYYIVFYSGMEFESWMNIAMVAVTILALMGIVFMFPLQARYTNTVKNTIKNAFLMALAHLPTVFLLIAVYAVPVLIYAFLPQLLPALFLLSFGLIIYFKSFILLKVFNKYENIMAARDGEAQEDGPDGGIFTEKEDMGNEDDGTSDENAAQGKVYKDGKFVQISENNSNSVE